MRFDTSDFVRSHGKAPRGRGCWAFSFGGDWVFSPSMTFTEAKQWAREQAPAGCQVAVVGP